MRIKEKSVKIVALLTVLALGVVNFLPQSAASTQASENIYDYEIVEVNDSDFEFEKSGEN